ncbi:hypothetical protein ACU686_24820 [Yinghuangia aomiensis]
MVAAAVEHAAGQRADGTPAAWPKNLDAKFPAEVPEGARRQLYILLAAAPEQVQRAVIPALDARAIQQLTVYYPLSAAVRAHLYDVCGMRAAVANAAHWEMPAEVVDGLLDLDDPEVNAYLYDFGAIAQDERVRICARRRRDGGAGEVAISPALVDLLARTSPSRRRTWLLAALDSGDPALVRAMLGRTRLNTEAGRLRVAIGLWERHGPVAVAALLDETEYPGRRPGAKHPFPATTHQVLRAAIAASDAGLASLHEALAAARAPEEVARYVIGRGAKAAERLEHFDAEYGTALPWRLLVATDAESPLPAPVLEALIGREDCPRELLRAFLARNSVHFYRVSGPEWLNTALADGRLRAEDLLALATPAAAAVEHLTEAVTAGRLAPRRHPGRDGRRRVLAGRPGPLGGRPPPAARFPRRTSRTAGHGCRRHQLIQACGDPRRAAAGRLQGAAPRCGASVAVPGRVPVAAAGAAAPLAGPVRHGRGRWAHERRAGLSAVHVVAGAAGRAVWDSRSACSGWRARQ